MSLFHVCDGAYDKTDSRLASACDARYRVISGGDMCEGVASTPLAAHRMPQKQPTTTHNPLRPNKLKKKKISSQNQPNSDNEILQRTISEPLSCLLTWSLESVFKLYVSVYMTTMAVSS